MEGPRVPAGPRLEDLAGRLQGRAGQLGGVAIDGANDDVGNVDKLPTGDPAFFDAPDRTFNVPSAFGTWEQVSGKGDAGSLVYTFELKGATTASNAPEPTTEIDSQQWQFAVPTAQPTNVGQAYANVVHTPLRATAAAQANTPEPRN